jgi:CHAD domain-containing protein
MKVMTALTLTNEEKQILRGLSNSTDKLLAHRARLILAYADGKATMQAAQEAGISRGRARFWKRQFLAHGMGIFQVGIPIVEEEQTEVEVTSKAEGEPLGAEKDYTKDYHIRSDQPIHYPERRSNMGITAEDSLVEAAKKVWSYHFAEMLSREEGTMQGQDIEELHDMRVATRRMRSAFDIFGQAFPSKIMKQHLQGLRKIGMVLGKVRDLDVLLEKAVCYQQKLDSNERPGLQPLLDDWSHTIERKRSKMVKHLHSEEYQNFKHEFSQFLQISEPMHAQVVVDDGTFSRVGDIVPVLIYSRYAAVRAYEAIVPTASLKQLHCLRIEFKKFRYTLEYFREILGEDIRQAISELKHLQDHLGELHDADVACQLVMDFMREWDENQQQKPISVRMNPEPIATYLAYLYTERYQLTSSFPELWRKFNRTEFRQVIAQAVSSL